MSRKLIIKNNRGVQYDISASGDPFLYKSKGFGVANTVTFDSSTNGFFKATSKKYTQGSIAGSMMFFKRPYESYNAFLNFILNSKELKIGYAPVNTMYYATCELTRLDKSELVEKYGYLECPIEFKLLSPWAREVPSKLSIETEEERLTLPATLPAIISTSAAGELTFTINGEFGAVEIGVDGTLINPVFTLSQDGETFGKLKINGVIGVGEKLEYSTRPDNSYIRKVSGGIVTDLTDSVDMDFDAFARPRNGVNVIAIESDSTIETVATVNVYDYYRGV